MHSSDGRDQSLETTGCAGNTMEELRPLTSNVWFISRELTRTGALVSPGTLSQLEPLQLLFFSFYYLKFIYITHIIKGTAETLDRQKPR